jgi:uncharacterized membrane protein YdjX (TVP38/TMEM64 family)
LRALKQIAVGLVIVLILKATYLFLLRNEVFDGDLDQFMYEQREKPGKLFVIFLAAYVLAALTLFPAPVLTTVMAFTYTHMFGLWQGSLLTYVWNYVCYVIASSFVFLMARQFLGEYLNRAMV